MNSFSAFKNVDIFMAGFEGALDIQGTEGLSGSDVQCLYDILVKVCVKPEDPGAKRTAHRAGLSLFARHSKVLS